MYAYDLAAVRLYIYNILYILYKVYYVSVHNVKLNKYIKVIKVPHQAYSYSYIYYSRVHIDDVNVSMQIYKISRLLVVSWSTSSTSLRYADYQLLLYKLSFLLRQKLLSNQKLIEHLLKLHQHRLLEW